LTFAVICLILFLGVTVFFRVGVIDVEGETRYTAAEVIEASGIAFGDHLFFVNDEAADRAIRSSLPYIGRVEVRRHFPNRLTVTVAETLPVARLQTADGYLILDRDAKVLEIAATVPLVRLIEVIGMPMPISSEVGEILAPGEEDADKLRYLQDILGTVSTLGIANDVSRIDMTDLYDPVMLYYNGRFLVRLGPNRNLHHKMNMLVSILPTMDEHDTGTIDLSLEQPSFRYHVIAD